MIIISVIAIAISSNHDVCINDNVTNNGNSTTTNNNNNNNNNDYNNIHG